jgi:hypothetical protein
MTVEGDAPDDLTFRLGIRPDGTAEDVYYGSRRIS